MSIINHCRKLKINYRVSLFIIFLCAISCNALGVSLAAKQKYPFTLLTNDYGILNDHDLSFYLSYMHPASHFPKRGSNCIYWQCFPRENISITLEDYGEFVEEFKKDTVGELNIEVMAKPGVFHHYCLRRAWVVNDLQKEFIHWRKLMHKEKYVCLAGEFVDRTQTIENGTKNDVSLWGFEQLKTKKGCVGYLGSSC